MATPAVPPLPAFAEALRVWLRIGCLSFGGPAGQIALLHREVVDRRGWVSDRRFLHALNFCTFLPGPEAQQLATYLGWLMHGVPGGLAAGLLFVLPGALVMLALSAVYVLFGAVPLVAALFFGLKAAVLVLVLDALLRIGRRALGSPAAWSLAAAAFAALFLLRLPFPLVVLAAALAGALAPRHFVAAAHGAADHGSGLIDRVLAGDPGRAARLAVSARRAGLAAVALWLAPVAALLPLGGTFADVALFFSRMAVVTFGGAYAVLAYVAQEAVERHGWLSAAEMLSGLGLAETTPGPLILVLQFVGFLAGFRAPGDLTGLAGGLVATALTLWVTFAPCFAFVFLGAPLVERLHGRRRLTGALAAITAAVVGVIANLALWFGIQTMFRATVPVRLGPLAFDAPAWPSLDPWALALAVLAGVALLGLRLGVARVLALCAAASIALHLARGLG